jgi:hypothetical protein
MNFAALDSRLLLEDGSGSNALAIKIAGHYGAGKSHTLTKCLELFPQSEYHLMSAGSAKSLYYLDGGLKHKALIATEAFQFQSKRGADSEISYIVRSLLSEGSVRYQVTENIKGQGRHAVEKRLDGPTSFITTTIMDKLERQLEDRLFTVHPDESADQTMDIIAMTARLKDGSFNDVDINFKQAWQLFHESLEPVEVVIPFASKIADHIRRGPHPQISMRRAFKRVLMIIQTVACAYQHQRQRDNEDRVIANISDYWMALQIVREAFRENLTNQSDETERRLDFIVKQGLVQFKSLTAEWNLSKGAVSGLVKSLVEKGILIWCDREGKEFDNNAELNKAKRSGSAYIKANEHYDFFGLPTPFEVTGDSRWGKGGEMLELYDLKLNARDMDEIEGYEEDSTIDDLFDEGFFPFGNGADCELSLEELVREDV